MYVSYRLKVKQGSIGELGGPGLIVARRLTGAYASHPRALPVRPEIASGGCHDHGPPVDHVTDAVVSVEGEALRPVTWIIVQDVALCAWGVGGDIVSTEGLREMGGRD